MNMQALKWVHHMISTFTAAINTNIMGPEL